MTELSAGRYGPAHGDIIEQLLARTDMPHNVREMYVMAHVRELERERDVLGEALNVSRATHNMLRAERDGLEHQLNHIITGE